jgi:hypothetical protein
MTIVGILTGIRDFDYETAIWDLVTCSYAWNRLAQILPLQRKVFRDAGVAGGSFLAGDNLLAWQSGPAILTGISLSTS